MSASGRTAKISNAGFHAMMDWIVCSKLWNCYNMIMKKKTTDNRELRGGTGMDFTDKLLHGGDYNPEQ